MHPYLMRLGVRPEVQAFFAPFYSDNSGDLVFQQGNYREHFGLSFHRVQAGNDLWIAGESDLALAARAFISHSVMDIIAFLHYYGHTLANWDRAVFIATGASLTAAQLRWISDNLADKSLTLLFPADLPGAVADLKVAAAFRRVPAAAFLSEKERLKICFRNKIFEFDRPAFSLSAFEKVSGSRFNVATRKPKHGASFLEQLRAGAFPTH
jgi:hypothetical protein